MCAIRFLYGTTLGKKDFAEQIPLGRKEDKLPTVLSRDEVLRFLRAVTDLRMRTIFITIYAAGLRVSEVVALTAACFTFAKARGGRIATSCCRSSC
jgi:integrase/recombinase XerD